LKIAAYGTLRKGMYNFDRFDLIYIETKELKGFRLYDLGPYPYVVYTGNDKDVIVVDILQCDDYTKLMIDSMEKGAGYRIMTIDDFDIYVFPNVLKNTKLVKNGDYVTYIQNDKTNSIK